MWVSSARYVLAACARSRIPPAATRAAAAAAASLVGASLARLRLLADAEPSSTPDRAGLATDARAEASNAAEQGATARSRASSEAASSLRARLEHIQGQTRRAAAAASACVAGLSRSQREATPHACAQACVNLLRSAVRTPFQAYFCERLFTVELDPPYPGAPVLVLLPGYGSGSGLWACNLDDLAAHFHVYAVDWLGTGASERPAFSARDVAEGERFFTDSLHVWMCAQRLAKGGGDGPHAASTAPPRARVRQNGSRIPLVVVGHSLGGYLAAAYMLQQLGSAGTHTHTHTHIDHLILVSPAGIPTPPPMEELAKRRTHWLMGLLQYAWEAGVTPQGIIRALGGLGERWATDIITRRFAGILSRNGWAARLDRVALTRYLYLVTSAEGSGEFALNVLLSFGAHARAPMHTRLLAAATERAAAAPPGTSPLPPLTLIYGGAWDWMPVHAGEALARDLTHTYTDAQCLTTPDSGHHLYMEAPGPFRDAVLARTQALRRDRPRPSPGA